jgi:SAM-dependent methyltransferase
MPKDFICFGFCDYFLISSNREVRLSERTPIELDTEGLSSRVRTVCCSVFETGFAAASFDIIWEEGVFHLLEVGRVLDECARLLEGGGFLVMGETNKWIETTRGRFAEHGFSPFQHVPLPPGSWWTRYYGPLEERVVMLRRKGRGPEDRKVFGRIVREIESVKADVSNSDCSFVIIRRPV